MLLSSTESGSQTDMKQFSTSKRSHEAYDSSTQPIGCDNFPRTLHRLLECDNLHDVLCWSSDGVVVHFFLPELVKRVLLPYFHLQKAQSFFRKMNRWGFRKITMKANLGVRIDGRRVVVTARQSLTQTSFDVLFIVF